MHTALHNFDDIEYIESMKLLKLFRQKHFRIAAISALPVKLRWACANHWGRADRLRLGLGKGLSEEQRQRLDAQLRQSTQSLLPKPLYHSH